ncbi:unnamed protein product [Plasmodium vivax]|uniref:(malaria parasite P. vivax) hypothetical protein n=1 Tax=Plasmodium vivax TaxID=5855 RepID=A0A8S4HJB0_PLAVI|nr:unnamed protein product [Plasmodium vivax]CAI7717637.1 PIR protein [Plasmodium vivax]
MDPTVVDNAFKLLSEDVKFKSLSELFILRTVIDVVIMGNFPNAQKCKECTMKDTAILKICCNLKKILEDWNEYCKVFNLDCEKCNDYFIYWLYGKIKNSNLNVREIKNIYSVLMNAWKIKLSNKACNIKHELVVDKGVIKYKKELYDFLEYYEYIKKRIEDKQHSSTEFCEYIWYAFELYKKMHSDSISYYYGYYDKEIEKFKSVFTNVQQELEYLENKCNNNILDSVFDKTNKVIRVMKKNETKEYIRNKFDSFHKSEKGLLEKKSSLFKFYLKLDGYYAKRTTDSCESSDDNFFMKNIYFCNIWHSIKEMLEEWNRKSSQPKNFTYNKECDYLNYWLYDKLKDHNDTRNIIPFLYEIRKLFTAKGYCNSKRYEFLAEQLENKKILHDFVEYYDLIKDKLTTLGNTEREKYCDYMKVFFDLYKDMEQNKSLSQGYIDEIRHFKAKFYGNTDELNFINSKCPGKCLNYIFTDKYKIFCPSDQGRSLVDLSDGAESCGTENSFTPHYSSNEKDFIPNDSDLDKAYKELDEEDPNVYYKQYCTGIKSFECKHKGVSKICHKLVKNLMHLSEMPKDTKRDERCYLLKHWLYRELRKIFSSNINDVSKEPVITKLKEVFFNINNKYLSERPCYCYFDDTMDKWKDDKQLHDYFQIYEKLAENIKTSSNSCDNYFGYLSSINKLYKKYIGECCYCFKSENCTDICPGYFKCDEKFNPYNLYLQLKCTGEPPKYFEKVDKPLGIDHYVITESQKYALLQYRLTSDPFYMMAFYVLGVLGIFMTFFVFYKFTPLGNIMHKRGNTNRNQLIEAYEQELAQNSLRNNNVNRNQRRIQLAYSA